MWKTLFDLKFQKFRNNVTVNEFSLSMSLSLCGKMAGHTDWLMVKMNNLVWVEMGWFRAKHFSTCKI